MRNTDVGSFIYLLCYAFLCLIRESFKGDHKDWRAQKEDRVRETTVKGTTVWTSSRCLLETEIYLAVVIHTYDLSTNETGTGKVC